MHANGQMSIPQDSADVFKYCASGINEQATSKPSPIDQPTGPSAPSIGLANGFMNEVKPSMEVYRMMQQLSRCTADLLTGLHAEPLTESGLKNLVCDIKSITISLKNYVITEVTANMAGHKATFACLNRVRQFYSQRPFVVPALLVELWPFTTSATLT
ncbi:MAG: hypothetical protein EZS28_000571 [Streblomastix strix]|uniref:Uncharacterized protein n=1 Tax=Streblomastix strix TaxID=222440 RepID=A0A5J4X9D1_9EUKA|nr:MAG: hypothetical protein EZS28_000571 [Streblomastix strix]